MNLPAHDIQIELDVVAAPPNPLMGPVHDVGQIDRLQDHRTGLVASEVDEIADQRGQFLDLGQHVRTQAGHLLVRQPRRARLHRGHQQLDVGAQRRQRGA